MRLLLIFLLALTVGYPQAQKLHVGTVEFFGTSGIDVQKVLSVLPIREGEEISEDEIPGVQDQIKHAIDTAVGHLPTDISLTCCNAQQNLMIYIGLGGRNTARISLRPAPKDGICLPTSALLLHDQAMDAVERAVEKGDSTEDDSRAGTP